MGQRARAFLKGWLQGAFGLGAIAGVAEFFGLGGAVAELAVAHWPLVLVLVTAYAFWRYINVDAALALQKRRLSRGRKP